MTPKESMAKTAYDDFREAEKKYKRKLESIFREGTLWKCYHGSSKGYNVFVNGIAFDNRIIVTNTISGLSKRVQIEDLREE